MNLNLIDFSQATAAAENIEDHGVKQVTSQVIPVLQAATSTVISEAQDRLDRTLGDAINGLDAVLKERIQSLDGWTLKGSVTLNFDVRLSAPEPKEAAA